MCGLIFDVAGPTLIRMSEHRYTNALAAETSPYLLQHAHNPVQWYPWSEEALRKARQEDKPILLSVGYSACHWCHVMERESFENEEIAGLMNDLFVNIKVDREERPDLDAIYMQAVQAMTGRGGWPMTVFLTPDQVPFYGGTYFPPEDRHGMAGFPRVLLRVAQAYRDRKEEIGKSAASVLDALRKSNEVPATGEELSISVADRAVSSLMAIYDEQNGGFGTAPKFPPSMPLDFLMRSFARTRRSRFLEAVDQTLRKMAWGGMYDQLGGGFHRYSVDERWLVPHFEKMLYDNALLSRIYLNAFQLTGEVLYRRVAEETLDFVLREMTSPEGGFYSSLDADSEGEEGKFYTWEWHEVRDLVGEDGAELFSRYYGVTETGELDGRNILHIPRPAGLFARLNNVSEIELLNKVARGKQILFKARERRVRPARDEKVITAWNGLMLKSFSNAAQILDRGDYRRAAVRCAEFLMAGLEPEGRLRHSFRNGSAAVDAYLDDYACLADGLLSLYESCFDPRWLRNAIRLSGIMVDRFHDPAGAGFFLTSDGHGPLIHRPKDFYDNAVPSGNSMAVSVLLHLAKLTTDERWLHPAIDVLRRLTETMALHPTAFGHLLCALDFALSSPLEIAVIGSPRNEAARALLMEVSRRYLPNKVVACGEGSEPALLTDKPKVEGCATAYVCSNHVCRAPVTSAADLAAQLDGTT